MPDKYDIADPNDPNTLRVPFMWMPHGCEPDPEWLRAHPGWVRIPAVMVPRDPHPGESGPQWNVQLGAPSEPAAPPAAAPPAAPEPEPRTFFAPVGRATDWPVDRDGRPWPRTAFGQPQCPLNEFPPGMRAPGEAIPPEDRLEYFDPSKFDPIGTFLAMKPVLDDPASAVGIVAAAGQAKVGSRPESIIPVRASAAAEANRRVGGELLDPPGDVTDDGGGSPLGDAAIRLANSQTITGLASYYDPPPPARLMANGRPFDRDAMNAAVLRVPLGTVVSVALADNPARSVTVTITDRGPYVAGRVIDLTPAAFTALVGSRDVGVARVVVTVP